MEFKNLIPWHRDREAITTRREMEPFYALHDRMNRLFDDVLQGGAWSALSPFASTRDAGIQLPRVDVIETEEEVRIEAELPGVEEKDIELQLSEGVLCLSGEKQSETKVDEKDYHHVERSWGKFQRSVRLPCEVVAEKTAATFKNGVLTVRLPKVLPAQPATHKIPVRGEG